MAVVGTNLTSGGQIASQSSFTTASIAPTGNNLILISVSSIVNGSDPNAPTVTGDGLTFVQIATVVKSGNGTQHIRMTLLRGLVASPSSGVLTIDFGGQNQAAASWSVNQFANIDTSGTNGSGAIVQSATNSSTGTTTGIAVTLSAFSGSGNATYGASANDGLTTITHGAAFTELSAANYDEDEWAVSNQTTVDWTWSSNTANNVAVAAEIKVTPAIQAGNRAYFM